MEPNELIEQEAAPKGCANCNNPIIQEGYPTPLCSDCRTALIKFPIPRSILIFAGVVALAVLFAMFNVPKSLSAGIHLSRGKKAIKEKNYLTAQHEFEKVNKAVPGYTAVREYLTLSAFYNQDLPVLFTNAQEIVGKQAEDQDLVGELNGIIEKMMGYVPSDSFSVKLNAYQSSDSISLEAFADYIGLHPDEIYPLAAYSSILLDRDQYKQCDSMLNILLERDPTHSAAILMKSTVKRQLLQYDSAQYYAGALLSMNKQSVLGMCSMSRTLLRQKKDKEGLDWALKSYELNHKSPYAIGTLVLAYHFNNNWPGRDQLINDAKKDSSAFTQMQYVQDVIAGKEKFRDN